MEITLFHKNMNQEEVDRFNSYFESKVEAIGNLLTKFADDAKLLKASVEKFDKHDAYEVELILSLPAKSLVAKEASHQITKAVDLSKDRLLSQIKKHMAHLRHERSHATIRDEKVAEQAVQEVQKA